MYFYKSPSRMKSLTSK